MECLTWGKSHIFINLGCSRDTCKIEPLDNNIIYSWFYKKYHSTGKISLDIRKLKHYYSFQGGILYG